VGTRLTECWDFRPTGIAGFPDLFGAAAGMEIEKRRAATRPAIKVTAEAACRDCWRFCQMEQPGRAV
jgi:hypothetical protein